MRLRLPLLFYVVLIMSGAAAFFLHSQLSYLSFSGILGRAYLVNNFLAALVFSVLLRLRNRHTEKLGFVFLAGTGLKFLAFFLFIYPTFHLDGELSRNEFVIFFVPYALSTTVEIVFLAAILNRL